MNAVATAFDMLAPEYDDTFHSRRCRIEDRLIGRRLRRFLSDTDGHILDVGCGTGAVLDLLDCTPSDYVGVDISRQMLFQAVEAHPGVGFVHCPAEALPFNAETFSAAVSSFSALSYSAAPYRAVREIYRVLRPGGRALVMVYAPRWYRHGATALYDLHIHLAPAAWTDWQARTRFERAGFTEIQLTAFSALPTWALPLEDRMQRFMQRWPMAGRYLLIEATKP